MSIFVWHLWNKTPVFHLGIICHYYIFLKGQSNENIERSANLQTPSTAYAVIKSPCCFAADRVDNWKLVLMGYSISQKVVKGLWPVRIWNSNLSGKIRELHNSTYLCKYIFIRLKKRYQISTMWKYFFFFPQTFIGDVYHACNPAIECYFMNLDSSYRKVVVYTWQRSCPGPCGAIANAQHHFNVN